jgi:tetratricopeptide (TPR) repeat protein
MIQALTALGAIYLRQGDLTQARAYLEEGYELSLTQHFPWQRSEICYQSGLTAMAEGQLDEAENWAQRAQTSVNEGSAPDWLGPTYVLLARVAQRRGLSTKQVASLYQQAMSLAEARCRSVERAWILREAGAYLATQAASAIGRQAEE